MNIDILCVGRLSEPFYRDAVEEYALRLSRYCRLAFTEVNDLPAPEGLSERMVAHIQREETQAMLNRMPKGAVVIALDRQGVSMTSEEFAAFIGIHQMSGKRIAFMIGGSLGLDRSAVRQADHVLSLGKMTYPHSLVRVMLVEQIYRAFRIIRGEPYHK